MITKREKLGGGSVALLSIVAVPLIQMWADERTKRAAASEMDWYVPIISSQYQTIERQQQELSELRRLIVECRGRGER